MSLPQKTTWKSIHVIFPTSSEAKHQQNNISFNMAISGITPYSILLKNSNNLFLY
eukprot:c29392_g1_i2 orf=321-485(+)